MLLFYIGKFLEAISPSRKAYACWQNILKERVIVIIPITKDEAQKLNKKYGVKFGDYGISSTHTKHKKFFLTENKANLNALNKIRSVMTYKKYVSI